jgi:predicted amidohydrolase YtcJ
MSRLKFIPADENGVRSSAFRQCRLKPELQTEVIFMRASELDPSINSASEGFLMNSRCNVVMALIILMFFCGFAVAEEADLIIYHGKLVTVDPQFAIQQAMAVKGDRILRVGRDAEVLKLRGQKTKVVDLGGKTVLPGLIDSHAHPGEASMTEFDHPIPDMETLQDVLDYIKSRARVLKPGEWIQVHQVFITRLKEQRYPTRQELDAAALNHPVVFATGPDAALNTLALKLSGIDRNFRIADGGPGYIEKDPQSGEPTGILRSCTRYVRSQSTGKVPTAQDRYQRLLLLLQDYVSVGITAIGDGDTMPDEIERYRQMQTRGELMLRVSMSQHVETLGPIEEVQQRIHKVAEDPLCRGDSLLRIIGVKTYLDGGMLTGSAYMLQPWGLSKIYSITDPDYRGLLFIPKERLLPMVQAAVELGLQFTAHSVGDGAVQTLLDVYEEINRKMPVAKTRPSLTHSNFMSQETVEQLARLGAVANIQPAWLYLDARTLVAQFGYDRLRYFQPLRSLFAAKGMVGGGSDHMQKIGSFRSINPYNPFLGMWVAVTRKAKNYNGALHPEEALSREQALRFYTLNNAYLLFREKEIGSLEPGKLADFIVIDRDLLGCPVDDILKTQVLETYLGGRRIFVQGAPEAKRSPAKPR